MAANRSMLRVRVDADLRQQAVAVLTEIGLSTSDAVRLLFHRIAADQTFPLAPAVPRAEAPATTAEPGEVMLGSRSHAPDASKPVR